MLQLLLLLSHDLLRRCSSFFNAAVEALSFFINGYNIVFIYMLSLISRPSHSNALFPSDLWFRSVIFCLIFLLHSIYMISYMWFPCLNDNFGFSRFSLKLKRTLFICWKFCNLIFFVMLKKKNTKILNEMKRYQYLK